MIVAALKPAQIEAVAPLAGAAPVLKGIPATKEGGGGSEVVFFRRFSSIVKLIELIYRVAFLQLYFCWDNRPFTSFNCFVILLIYRLVSSICLSTFIKKKPKEED